MHPPHESAHSFRDIAIHLGIITVGLLIALSLEGVVEWRHHRHLVHQAEDALRGEIASNAKDLPSALDDVKKQDAELDHDVETLHYVMSHGAFPKSGSMSINFHIRTFDNVAWKTAQSTGALSYMTYDEAQKYADVYTTQDELQDAEKQGARDAIMCLASIDLTDDGPAPSKAEAAEMIGKINVLKGQLMLVNSLMVSLQKGYGHFSSAQTSK